MGIEPQGEKIRKAVKWLDQQLQERPPRSVETLIADAALNFNLSPKETEFLLRTFTRRPPSRDGSAA